MRYNTYQPSTYGKKDSSRSSSRSTTRGTSKNEVIEKPGLGKRLIEEFMTQLIVCTLVSGVIFGAQLLKLPNMSRSLAKIKTIITYSPSLTEVVEEFKEGTSILVEKINNAGKEVKDQEISVEDAPIILVDDEIF